MENQTNKNQTVDSNSKLIKIIKKIPKEIWLDAIMNAPHEIKCIKIHNT